MPLQPGDAVSLVVRLGGEAFRGDPRYEIVVDGETLDRGVVDWSRETTVHGRYGAGDQVDWRDVAVDLTLHSGGFETIEVRFPNDAYRRGVGDRNLLVDHIALNGQVLEAEAHDVAYRGGKYADGGSAERMPWEGALVFDASAVPLETPRPEMPEGAYIREGEAGAVVGALTLDDRPPGGDVTVTLSDDRFEVVDGAVKLRDDVALYDEITPVAPLTVTVTSADGTEQSHAMEIAVGEMPGVEAPRLEADVTPSFEARYFDVDDSLRSLNDIDWGAEPTHAEAIDGIDYENSSKSFWEGGARDTFGVEITGQIAVPQDGRYTFHLGGDDGAALWINGEPVIVNDGLHSYETASVELDLSPGVHAIEVRYFENYGKAGLKLEWEGPGIDGRSVVTPAPAEADGAVVGIEGVPLPLTFASDGIAAADAVTIAGLPAGTLVETGARAVTVGADPVEIAGGELGQMTITPPLDLDGDIAAEIRVAEKGVVPLTLAIAPAPTDLVEARAASGFAVEFFEEDHALGTLADVDFDAAPVETATMGAIAFETTKGAFREGGATDRFALRAKGDIVVEEGGVYDFRVGGDDGAVLFVNGIEVVDNDGLHGFRNRDGQVELEPGRHEIELRYFENAGRAGLKLDWRGPDTGDAFATVEAAPGIAADGDAAPVAIEVSGLTEVAAVTVEGLPPGTWLSDGTHGAMTSGEPADITDWDLGALDVALPDGVRVAGDAQVHVDGRLFNGAPHRVTADLSIEPGGDADPGAEDDLWATTDGDAWDGARAQEPADGVDLEGAVAIHEEDPEIAEATMGAFEA